MMQLNETPVRTSKNFNMNNVKLNDIEILEHIPEFNNVEITKTSNIKISSNVNKKELTYGLNEQLLKQVNNYSNQKLKLEIDDATDEETMIQFKIDEKNSILVDNIEIIANKNSKATIIIKYESEKNVKAFHNSLITTIAKQNSNINIIIINLLNTKSTNLISLENTFYDKSKINYTLIDFGGKNSITNYYSNLVGDNSKNNLNTIYLGKENQLFDLNYIAELRGKSTDINIEVQGALKDEAKKHFKGTIDFKKGAKKATGNENEVCMLLSDKAKSLALPMLLCSEEEVEGNHSTATGKIGEKELFYIMSRGLEKKEAMKLMVKAKFNQILENIQNEELKEQILIEIDERLD